MKLFLFPAVALLACAAPVMAPASAQGGGTTVEIDLSNFKFSPSTITLHHGQPYVLRFVNKASGGHDFSAKKFFAAATIAPESRKLAAQGKISLDGGQTAEVRLTAPAAGTYEAHCTHFMHSTFGMTGSIVVD